MITGIGALDFKSIGGTASLFEGAAPGAASPSPTQSFAAVLSDMAGQAVGTMQNAEQVSIRALQGDADTREVVDSVMSAEQALIFFTAITYFLVRLLREEEAAQASQR